MLRLTTYGARSKAALSQKLVVETFTRNFPIETGKVTHARVVEIIDRLFPGAFDETKGDQIWLVDDKLVPIGATEGDIDVPSQGVSLFFGSANAILISLAQSRIANMNKQQQQLNADKVFDKLMEEGDPCREEMPSQTSKNKQSKKQTKTPSLPAQAISTTSAHINKPNSTPLVIDASEDKPLSEDEAKPKDKRETSALAKGKPAETKPDISLPKDESKPEDKPDLRTIHKDQVKQPNDASLAKGKAKAKLDNLQSTGRATFPKAKGKPEGKPTDTILVAKDKSNAKAKPAKPEDNPSATKGRATAKDNTQAKHNPRSLSLNSLESHLRTCEEKFERMLPEEAQEKYAEIKDHMQEMSRRLRESEWLLGHATSRYVLEDYALEL